MYIYIPIIDNTVLYCFISSHDNFLFVAVVTFECADVYNTLATVKDLEQLRNTWSEWQEVVLQNKKEFPSVLELIAKSASLNGKILFSSFKCEFLLVVFMKFRTGRCRKILGNDDRYK